HPPKEKAPIGTGIGTLTPNHADFNVELELARCVAIASENSCAITKSIVIYELNGFVVVFNANYSQHGAKNFLIINGHTGGDIVDDAWSNEIAFGRDIVIVSIDDHRCAVSFCFSDELGYPVTCILGYQWPHLGGIIGAFANLDIQGALLDLRD